MSRPKHSTVRRCIVVLGMHRSGTSLISQALHSAGLSAGDPEQLLSAQADNPEGFFENARLVDINDGLLEDAKGSWFLPPAVLAPADPKHQSSSVSLLQSLQEFASTPFFIKDPRLCLTWPLWSAVLEDPLVVYVYRSPMAVATSLARRNQFPLQLGLLLWEIYNRAALQALVGARHVAVSYDALLSGEDTLNRLFTQIAAEGFTCNTDAVRDLLDPGLNHERADGAAHDALVTPSQRKLAEHCEQLCASDNSPLPASFLQDSVYTDDAVLRARARDLGEALAPLARVVETANERDDAQRLADERTADRDTALAALTRLENDHQQLAAAHQDEQARHAKAADTLLTLNRDHEALAAAHDAERTRHAALIEKFLAFQKEFEAYKVEFEAMRQRLEAEAEKAKFLFYSLTESYRSLLSFETSLPGRLSYYLRKAYRLVTLQRGKNSAYEDLLERAHAHFSEFEQEPPRRRRNKFDMAASVVRYVIENPAGSIRSFSWARLRRATSVFMGSSTEDLSTWVDARFPDARDADRVFDPSELSADLDDLELTFAEHSEPLVSIVIPVFNDYRVTMNCLRSLHECDDDIAFEVILADDCSTDLTASIADRVRGLTIAKTATNQRFLRNCKQAAAQARGEYLLFLNNDTAVTEGWLKALLAPFDDASVGVTGPKLLFANGDLQEAGGIIWRDASGWNFGRGDDPAKPAYNYLREVDYVSGACLMLRHTLWNALDGFDERFVPAYYEDADLCFAAREAGFKVVYQPQSVIYHYEGVSNGTDLDSGVKQHQVTNQQVFRDKWQAVLERDHFDNGQSVIHARDRSRHKPCVLFIDHYVPHHDCDAGGRSTYMYVRLLLELGYRVQFMGANFFPHAPYTQGLQALGVEVLVGESVARRLDDWFAEHAQYIDEVLLHRPHVAEQFLPHLERLKPQPPISFFGHDLHYLRAHREAALKDDDGLRREAERWRERELAVCARVDRVYYFSQAELDELAEHVPTAKLRRIPLYAMPVKAPPAYAPLAEPSLLFVGGYSHPPNLDAARWLAEEILPPLRDAYPLLKLHLVGSNAPASIRDLASDGVVVHGFLSDEALDALYRDVSVAVVPLRYGAGIKGKLIEAVGHGVPIVTTDIGAEGIPDAETVMWVANSAPALVKQLADILGDATLCSSKLPNYDAWLQTHFSRGRAVEALAVDRPFIASAVLPNSAQDTA